MIFDHVGGIRDPLKQDLAFEFCINQNKVISMLTKTHINHDQIHHVRNWLVPFSVISKWLLVHLYLGLEGIAEVDIDSKGKCMSSKVTPFNDRFFYVYVPSGYNTREQLAMLRFFEGLQNYMENKNREMKTK